MILMKKKISDVTFSSAEKLACILKYVETPTERISLRFLMPISIEKKKMAIESSKWRSKGGQHQPQSNSSKLLMFDAYITIRYKSKDG